MNNRLNEPRLLLAKLRNGDYAHPGEKEAIDIVFKKIMPLLNQNSKSNQNQLVILDVGCGLGGTAAYIREKTNAIVCGIDIDKNALAHAKKCYPKIQLFESDAALVVELFKAHKFDLIYLFNVFYAFSDPAPIL